MEQTSQSRWTQEHPNIAEVNLTTGDNNTAELNNKYSEDMLVDTRITQYWRTIWNTRVSRHRKSPITVPNRKMTTSHARNVNHTNTVMRNELTGRRHYFPPTDDELQLPTPTKARNGTKNYEQKENCWHIVNEHKAKRDKQRHRNYNPYLTTTTSPLHDSRIQSSYAKY